MGRLWDVSILTRLSVERGSTRAPYMQQRRTAPRRAVPIILATVVSLISAACVQSTSSGGSSVDSEPKSTIEGQSLGDQMTIDVHGQTRSYLLYVPPGHDVDEPAP